MGGVQQPLLQGFKNQTVKKHGFATGNRLGIVFGIAEDLTVPFDAQHIVHYANQLAIRGSDAAPFSAGGDSGALVLDAASSRPVGMINGGTGPWTIASHIDYVLGPNLQIV
jgi:hypothetical protein